MQAILMAGGEGRRLRPITAVLPKPLVPIDDEICVLEMVLHQLRHYGFSEVVLCVGYRAELVMAVVGDGRRFGLKARFHREERPLGTVGALAELEGLDENFLVMNGDICTDMDFGALLRSHSGRDVPATIASFQRREKIELGVLELDDTGRRLRGFREKPEQSFWVAMGVNAYRRDTLELIPRGRPFGFDRLVHKLLEADREVQISPHHGFWLDIGRPDDYEKLLDEFPRRRDALLPADASPAEPR